MLCSRKTQRPIDCGSTFWNSGVELTLRALPALNGVAVAEENDSHQLVFLEPDRLPRQCELIDLPITRVTRLETDPRSPHLWLYQHESEDGTLRTEGGMFSGGDAPQFPGQIMRFEAYRWLAREERWEAIPYAVTSPSAKHRRD